MATLHFPAGVYTLNAVDELGYHYRAHRKIAERAGGGSLWREGGTFVSKRDPRKLRGYRAGAITHVGNLPPRKTSRVRADWERLFGPDLADACVAVRVAAAQSAAIRGSGFLEIAAPTGLKIGSGTVQCRALRSDAQLLVALFLAEQIRNGQTFRRPTESCDEFLKPLREKIVSNAPVKSQTWCGKIMFVKIAPATPDRQ